MGRPQFLGLSESSRQTSVREGGVREVGDTSTQVQADDVSQTTIYTNDGNGKSFLELVTLSLETVEVNMRVRVDIKDSDGVTQAGIHGNPENFPVDFLQPLGIPEGHSVVVNVYNNTGDSRGYHVSGVVRQ